MEKEFFSGNQAVAIGAYDAGCRVGCAYPGTPSTEVLESFSFLKDVYAEWSVNEKVAFDVAYGASIGGVRAFVSMKHVGLNVASDSLFTSVYAGVNAGFVVVSADDPGIHSSQNEQDNRNYSRFAKIPMLEPSDVQEAYTFAYKSFSLSERFDLPFLIRLTTRISHVKGLVSRLPRDEILKKDVDKSGEKYVMLPVNAIRRRKELDERLRELEKFSERCEFNYIIEGKRRIGIIASGISFANAMEAVPDAYFLKIGLYPLPKKLIKKFVGMVDKVYVVEELDPFLELEIKAMGIDVIGKDVFPSIGEMTPDIIRERILGERKQYFYPNFSLPQRPPMFCPGCPHEPVFSILSELGVFVGGDIGCYTLGALEPFKAMHTCISMGASIGTAFGVWLANNKIKQKKEKNVAVIGDSTFLHGGIPGIMDIVYNKGSMLLIVLDNHTTAMTGGQEHPGTGMTALREPTKRIDIKKLLEAIGVDRVYEVNPYKKEELKKLIQQELENEGVSAIVTNKPCVLKKTKA
jgi:indolepyruvate ferredoxin oxidoreductase alpha subunit